MMGMPRATARQVHRVIGLVMLLPLVAWAATGAVFFTKPGYGAAYDALPIRTYPLEGPITLRPDPTWREVRHLRTILGLHLLARTDKGWAHLDPNTLQPAAVPRDEDVKRLIADAFAVNPSRYGQIVTLTGGTATTDTGAVIKFDWNRLTLQQRGRDTDRIDRIYKIHYLQWTGQETVDKVLGFAGLVLLVTLSGLGARLAFRRG
jgi:uncharacterized iron-regulated membrane protein